MKLFVLSFLLTLVLSEPVPISQEDETQWELFKIEYEKEYRDEKEEEERRRIFVLNIDFIRNHNAKYDKREVTFTVGTNRFADMTNREFRSAMNGLKVPHGYVRKGMPFNLLENVTWDLPDYVDWRKKGAVTPVKDQGMCGSCWAFSATGSLEGQTFLKTKRLVSLSEQNLVDCSFAEGDMGCDGGLMDYAFQYIKDNQGIDTESSYPYEAKDGNCRYNSKNKGATDNSYVDIASGSEARLQQAVANIGPISVGIDAGHDSFQFYKGGVYKEPACSSSSLDHGVLVVGYGSSKNGGDHWRVKNSWGTSWGMQGYILMARNNQNMCGIATMASYPSV